MTSCPETGALVDTALDRVATQYRESPRLLGLIRALLAAAEAPSLALCPLPDFFDLDTATGDPLTLIGKWMGWPREHCRGIRNAVFGFETGAALGPLILLTDDGVPVLTNWGAEILIETDTDGDCSPCAVANGPVIGGFCWGTWDGCPSSEFSATTLTDDDLYRRFLKARRAQIRGDYSRPVLLAAARALFADDDLIILRERPGTVTLLLGRAFAGAERQMLHLYAEVLPVAPGVALDILSRPDDGPVFGFGDGWGGFCTGLWA